MKNIAFLFVFSTILLCSCGSKNTKDSQHKITAGMALEETKSRSIASPGSFIRFAIFDFYGYKSSFIRSLAY